MKDLFSLTFAIFFVLVLVSCNKDNCENSPSFSVTGQNTCASSAPGSSSYSESIVGGMRMIESNAIPDHQVGAFPNGSNPNTISAQSLSYSVPASPTEASSVTQVYNEAFTGGPGGGSLGYIFGVMLNGVPIDPVAAEPWENPNSGELNWEWNLEVLSSLNMLGTDCNNAHVQPSGLYHYHGTPNLALTGETGATHSALHGYAADGFPIYYKYCYSDPNDTGSPIVALSSSWRLKEGCRPGNGTSAPDGGYDGTYVQDYEYVAGSGDLDECNGRTGITPEYPSGTYYYVITDDFPSIPRCFKGTPDDSFTK